MLIVTTDGLAGYAIRNVLGDVLGTAAHGAQQNPQGAASGTFSVTGERPGAGLAGTRRAAVERLAEDAHRKGANAVVGMRFETVTTGAGAEVCAYGTAVWAEPAHATAQPPAAAQSQPLYPQHPPTPEYQPGGPPMAARNLTIGLHDDRR